MSAKSLRSSWFTALLLMALTACGGGGGSAGAGGVQTAGGGIGGSGVSFGSITQFGSIFVNGVEFSTRNAAITKDDASIDEQELRLGMTVEVRGSIDSDTSGNAAEVRVEEAVRGPVESVSAGTLVVLGQTVLVDDTTRFDDNVPVFAAIHVGDLLEVHGLIKGAGSIGATFIERAAPAATFEVRGFITDHSAAAQTFKIGALTMNYGAAAVNDMPMPSGSNWNGLFVEVRGSSCASTNPCGTLTATKVEPEGLAVADADEAEIEGFVTAAASPTQFTIGSQTVVTTASTVFVGGVSSDMVVGTKIEVEGSLVAGVLTAAKITFEDSIRLEANVASVGSSSLTVAGLPGVVVNVDSHTQFDGGASDLGSIAPGNHLRIRGRPGTAAGAVIATEVELRSPDTRVILQGPPTSVQNPNLTILGIAIDTTGVRFKDVSDNSITATTFFDALSRPGEHLVKAQGNFAAPTVTWEEIELED